MKPHTLAHALRPQECDHSISTIYECVICGKTLPIDRKHVDTCGSRCSRSLLRMQQPALKGEKA